MMLVTMTMMMTCSCRSLSADMDNSQPHALDGCDADRRADLGGRLPEQVRDDGDVCGRRPGEPLYATAVLAALPS